MPLKNFARDLHEMCSIIHKDILLFKIVRGLLTGFFCHYNYFARTILATRSLFPEFWRARLGF